MLPTSFALSPTVSVPFRVYVGIKGKLEDGTDAPEDDFLARNGLKYGNIYGFAIDMTNTTDSTGPTAGEWRDAFHKTATNGDLVPGKWIPQPWRWNGEVKNFQHDGAWDYQVVPPGAEAGGELEGYHWWTSAGPDEGGCKTEHNSPVSDGTAITQILVFILISKNSFVLLFYIKDPRVGYTAFVQSSVCGYFGHLYLKNVPATLEAAAGDLPTSFEGEYYVYQGETDVTSQIELGGKGQYTDGRNATRNWDKDGIKEDGKITFEDIDGLELL